MNCIVRPGLVVRRFIARHRERTFGTARRRRPVARRVKMGRKPKLTPHQMKEAIGRRDRGKETLREIARSYNVSHSTISRLGA